MSVIVSKRSISNMQFYKTARDLRRDITKMLEQMFSDESKFCYSRGLEYYLQTRILELMGQMMESITRANEIYPTTQDQVENAYKTWRGCWKKLGGDTRKTDSLYKELFGGVA